MKSLTPIGVMAFVVALCAALFGLVVLLGRATP